MWMWLWLAGCKTNPILYVETCPHVSGVAPSDAQEFAQEALAAAVPLDVELDPIDSGPPTLHLEAVLMFGEGVDWRREVYDGTRGFDSIVCPEEGAVFTSGEVDVELRVTGSGRFEGTTSVWVGEDGAISLQGSIDSGVEGLDEAIASWLRAGSCAATAASDEELEAVWSFGNGGLGEEERVGTLRGSLGVRTENGGCSGGGASWIER